MHDNDLHLKANRIREKLGEDAYSPIDIFAMALRISDLTVTFAELGENISGAFYRGKKSSLIAINSSMSLGRQRFSMAHELYHYFYDVDMGTIICPKTYTHRDSNEKHADAFASHLLIPDDGLYRMIMEYGEEGGSVDLHLAVRLEQYFRVSHSAMLYRLLLDNYISEHEYESYKNNVIAKAEMMNYDVSLYKNTERNETMGHYILLANRLHDEKKISDGKWKEILAEAFRTDVIEADFDWEDDAFD